jgi:hypothetical protein
LGHRRSHLRDGSGCISQAWHVRSAGNSVTPMDIRGGEPVNVPGGAISIVMPAYNEEANIATAVRRAILTGRRVAPVSEVVVSTTGAPIGRRRSSGRLGRRPDSSGTRATWGTARRSERPSVRPDTTACCRRLRQPVRSEPDRAPAGAPDRGRCGRRRTLQSRGSTGSGCGGGRVESAGGPSCFGCRSGTWTAASSSCGPRPSRASICRVPVPWSARAVGAAPAGRPGDRSGRGGPFPTGGRHADRDEAPGGGEGVPGARQVVPGLAGRRARRTPAGARAPHPGPPLKAPRALTQRRSSPR